LHVQRGGAFHLVGGVSGGSEADASHAAGGGLGISAGAIDVPAAMSGRSAVQIASPATIGAMRVIRRRAFSQSSDGSAAVSWAAKSSSASRSRQQGDALIFWQDFHTIQARGQRRVRRLWQKSVRRLHILKPTHAPASIAWACGETLRI